MSADYLDLLRGLVAAVTRSSVARAELQSLLAGAGHPEPGTLVTALPGGRWGVTLPVAAEAVRLAELENTYGPGRRTRSPDDGPAERYWDIQTSGVEHVIVIAELDGSGTAVTRIRLTPYAM